MKNVMKETQSEIGPCVEVHGLTDVGCVRSSNEDCFVIQPMNRPLAELNSKGMRHRGRDGDLFVAVSDGMGGAAAGEVASSTGLRCLCSHLLDSAQQLSNASIEEMVRIVEEGIQKANRAIFDAAQANRAQKGMGATMTALYLRDEVAYLFQIGDSRAYLYREEVFNKITRDQSFVGHLVEMGTISEEQAAKHPQRNVILQALGAADRLKVDISYISLCRGDLLILCSDGLYSEVSAKELEKKVQDLKENAYNLDHKVNCLLDMAKNAGGHDNITVVGVQCNDQFPPREPGEDPRFIPFPFLGEDNPRDQMFQIQA